MDEKAVLEVLQAVVLVTTIIRATLDIVGEVRKILEEHRHRKG